MEKQDPFWATLELFGHARLAGRVSEFQLGGTSFVRVEVPETPTSPPFDKLLNHAAIYAITPVDETIARLQAERISARPLEAYELSRMLDKKLAQDGMRLISAEGTVPSAANDLHPPDRYSDREDADDADGLDPEDLYHTRYHP